MTIKLYITNPNNKNYLPLFSEHTIVKKYMRKYNHIDGYVAWGLWMTEENDSPKYMKRENPKRIKRLLRTIKKTKSKILSIRSIFDNEGKFVKVFTIQ